MRYALILASLLMLICLGCDAPGRQQQAEEDRRQQTVDDLKSMGEAMHNNQSALPEASSTDAAGSSDIPHSADAP
ncbi:MAG: hypothetical protein KDA78_06175 [Planctomycetaceae bacterium]|nr:hypothetical protein [Planctomycetaceae bacterium]